MKILHINSVCGVTGTGRIVADLYEAAVSRGHDCKIAYGEHKYRNNPGEMQTMEIGKLQDCQVHGVMTRLFDAQGFGSRRATREFLSKVDEYRPDTIHLHNLHGYYMNIELLFNYLKSRKVKVVWTLHDCWPFTGHCVYFTNADCDRWQTGCYDCPLKKQYPASLGLDCSKYNYRRKKELFTGLEDMHLLVPSRWMEEKTRQSFLKDYPIKVIYNGIDLDVYQPRESDFREKYHLEDKFIVLGVANVWEERKGLKTFLQLAQSLGKEYQVVLVGLQKEQIEALPENVLGLPRTDTPKELAEIYTAADVFVNPGREETFGLTVAEAMACGTWPIVYAGTACAEVAVLGLGRIVQGDVRELEMAVRERRSVVKAQSKTEGQVNASEPVTAARLMEVAGIFSKKRFGEEVLAVYRNE